MASPHLNPITPALIAAAEAYGLSPDALAAHVRPGRRTPGCWRLRRRLTRGLPRVEAVEVVCASAAGLAGTASAVVGGVRVQGILWHRSGNVLRLDAPQVCRLSGEWVKAFDLPPEVWAALHLIVDTLAPYRVVVRRPALPRWSKPPEAKEATAAAA